MQYWRGPKQTAREAPQDYWDPGIVLPKYRPGPRRKQDLDQEFLLTLMKLKLGLINEDLAFRFMVSSTTFSRVSLNHLAKQTTSKKHFSSLFQETIPKFEMHKRLF